MCDRYLSDNEIVEITGKSKPTLWRWRKTGLFPKAKKLGPNSSGTKKSEVDEWFESPEAWVNKHQHLAAKGGAT